MVVSFHSFIGGSESSFLDSFKTLIIANRPCFSTNYQKDTGILDLILVLCQLLLFMCNITTVTTVAATLVSLQVIERESSCTHNPPASG